LCVLIEQIGRINALTQVPTVLVPAPPGHLAVADVVKPVLELLPRHRSPIRPVPLTGDHLAQRVVRVEPIIGARGARPSHIHAGALVGGVVLVSKKKTAWTPQPGVPAHDVMPVKRLSLS